MRKILLGIFFTVLFVATSLVAYSYYTYRQVYVGSTPTVKAIARIPSTPTPTPDPLAKKNILLLGYGGVGHEGGLLTDTIILAQIDPRENTATLISIPRDIWIPLEVKEGSPEHIKINAAYAVGEDDEKYPDKADYYTGRAGGGNMAKDAISLVTGQNVDNFISINFGGFTNVVDSLGGINVYVPHTFDDAYYPLKGKEDETCNKSDEKIEILTATMSGFLLEKEF